MDLVLDLPQVLVVDVLFVSLRFNDLCKYDSAMCNRQHRPKLRALYDMLPDVRAVITALPKTTKANISLIKWTGTRNIKITTFKFKGIEYWDEYYGHTEVVQKFLQQSGHHITRLTITKCDCPMSGAIALVTKACSNLDTLTVKDCALPFSIPQMLMRKGNHIRDLYLEPQWCNTSMISKSYFTKVTSHTVERFRLAGTLEIGCLQEVGRAFPNLQEIYLKVDFTTRENCSKQRIVLCDGSQCWLDFIAVCNPHLRTLGVCECGSLSIGTFKLMLKTWKNLTALEVLKCEHLQGPALYCISIFCANTLECFTYCGDDTQDVNLASALEYCQALRSLHIYCSIVENSTLKELLTKLTTLRELDLRNTSREPLRFALAVVAKHGVHLERFNYTPL